MNNPADNGPHPCSTIHQCFKIIRLNMKLEITISGQEPEISIKEPGQPFKGPGLSEGDYTNSLE